MENALSIGHQYIHDPPLERCWVQCIKCIKCIMNPLQVLFPRTKYDFLQSCVLGIVIMTSFHLNPLQISDREDTAGSAIIKYIV